MSDRLPAASKTQTYAPNTHPVVFVKLELTSVNGFLYIHNSIGTIVWDAQNWLGVGDLGDIGVVQEGEEISPYGLLLTLSGIDSTLIDETVNQDYFNRPVKVYIGYLVTNTHALVEDPTLMWSGKIDDMTLLLGKTNAIQLRAESDLAIFDNSSDELYSDAGLQDQFAGDLYFIYQTAMKDLRLRWGGQSRGFDIGGGGGTVAGGFTGGVPVISPDFNASGIRF